MNLILLGPPGSGKGTQAHILHNKYGYTQVSTGDIIRDEISKGTKIGQQVKEVVEAGKYPDDKLILSILEDHLQQIPVTGGVVFDGVPRTLHQAEQMDKMLSKLGRHLDLVVELEVDQKKLVDRLAARYACKTCKTVYNDQTKPTQVEGICDVCGGAQFFRRPDDSPDAVKTRMDVYNSQTRPLVEYYAKSGRLRTINANEGAEAVSQALSMYIKES